MAGESVDENWEYTPVMNALVVRYNAMTALVFGAVWMQRQGREQLCQVTLEELAKMLGVSKRTVMRHLKLLVEEGLLVDLTPGLRFKAHVYQVRARLG